MRDLWPENIAPIPELKAPTIILKEQASLLGKKTNNLLEATVTKIESTGFVEEKFNYVFLIVAPALDNYRYKLFTVSHGIGSYPVTIWLDEDMQVEIGFTEVVAESENEFMEILEAIFNTEKTKKTIGTLLSMMSYENNEDDIPF